MNRNISSFLRSSAAFLALTVIPFLASAQKPNPDLGFTDTPMLPGLPWHVHDSNRPHPPVISPGPVLGAPPSDAIVLFDGKDLSHWKGHASTITKGGKAGEPEWRIVDGVIEAVPGTGDLETVDKFGDMQLHIEWSAPNPPKGNSQNRGNSGVLLMGRFEVQVLDPYNNPTYADGQAAAIYGQWPPLANPGRKPGEWNVYDIVFEAPRMDGEKVLKPAIITVFFNGVLVHNHKESMGPMVYKQVAHYSAQPTEDALILQNHNSSVRYRNIWARRIGDYDRPEKK